MVDSWYTHYTYIYRNAREATAGALTPVYDLHVRYYLGKRRRPRGHFLRSETRGPLKTREMHAQVYIRARAVVARRDDEDLRVFTVYERYADVYRSAGVRPVADGRPVPQPTNDPLDGRAGEKPTPRFGLRFRRRHYWRAAIYGARDDNVIAYYTAV